MALRAGRVAQDQNLNVNYNGVSAGGQKIVSKAPKKGGTAGRKPLGDLSNFVNPLPKRESRKQNSDILSIADKVATTKVPFDVSEKKSVSKASQRTGARKALSDISNSVKPCLRETSEKNLNAKRGIVIEEECFLHNHQECCIKAQKKPDMDEFLHIVGLEKDFSGQSTLAMTPAMSNKAQPKSLVKTLELPQMDELLIEDQYPLNHNMSKKLVTSSATRTPEPPNQFVRGADHDCISYKLIETPYLPKH